MFWRYHKKRGTSQEHVEQQVKEKYFGEIQNLVATLKRVHQEALDKLNTELETLKQTLKRDQDVYIHQRINQRIDDIRENYVRRVQLLQEDCNRLARERDMVWRDNITLHDELLARVAMQECEMWEMNSASNAREREM